MLPAPALPALPKASADVRFSATAPPPPTGVPSPPAAKVGTKPHRTKAFHHRTLLYHALTASFSAGDRRSWSGGCPSGGSNRAAAGIAFSTS